MPTESYDRDDLLVNLPKEIKRMTPKYQKLATALIGFYIRQISEQPAKAGEDPRQIDIDIETTKNRSLPDLEAIFDRAFRAGPRGRKYRDEVGKVGGRYKYDLRQHGG